MPGSAPSQAIGDCDAPFGGEKIKQKVVEHEKNNYGYIRMWSRRGCVGDHRAVCILKTSEVIAYSFIL